MSYRPQVKADSNGTTQDLPIDAETVQGKTPVFTTTAQSISGTKTFVNGINVGDGAEYSTQYYTDYISREIYDTTGGDGDSYYQYTFPDKSGTFELTGHTHSNYVDLTNTQTITGSKSFTSGLKVSGRVANSGDDEGIVINTASNGYAGVCLGSNSGRRSVFYLDSNKAFWRYNNGSTSYDLVHPGKSGTIALTSDIPNISNQTYYLHTIRALKSGSGSSYIVFSLISTQSTAYNKESFYSAFPKKGFHASGYYNSYTSASYRVNMVYLQSATEIQFDYGNNSSTTTTYGTTYFTDEVRKIA